MTTQLTKANQPSQAMVKLKSVLNTDSVKEQFQNANIIMHLQCPRTTLHNAVRLWFAEGFLNNQRSLLINRLFCTDVFHTSAPIRT